MRAEDLPDSGLLALVRTQPDVLGVIYERQAPVVYRYLARRVGPTAAEDLLGEVFAAALGARFRVQPHVSGSALPWLYGIAGNIVRSHLRRSRAHSRADVASAAYLGSAYSGTVDWDAVDARLDATAQREQLQTALAALTEGEREILLLVAWEGLTPTEAAEALGLTAVNARTRLHRARAHAQAVLDQLTPVDL